MHKRVCVRNVLAQQETNASTLWQGTLKTTTGKT